MHVILALVCTGYFTIVTICVKHDPGTHMVYAFGFIHKTRCDNYVPRLDNKDVVHLAWIASSKSPIPKDIVLEKLLFPSVVVQHKELPSPEEPTIKLIDGPGDAE